MKTLKFNRPVLSALSMLVCFSILYGVKASAKEQPNSDVAVTAESGAARTEATGKETAGEESTGSEPGGTEVTEPEPSGSEPGGTEISGGNEEVLAGYQIRLDGTVLNCTYDGIPQVNQYLNVAANADGTYQVVKPEEAGSYIYYFDDNGAGTKCTRTGKTAITYQGKTTEYFLKNGQKLTGWYTKSKKKYYYSGGKMVTGWYQIKGKSYYFDKSAKNKGVLLTNTIAGSNKEGSYYVDETGVQVTSPEIRLAVEFVNAHTKKSWSDSKKLQVCYNYLWKNYTYERFYDTPKASSMSDYAVYMFQHKQGNCFRYASSFACIAKVLGYESRVAVGQISSTHGGMTPHGWAEVKVDGKWYLCDANMQRNFPKINSYMRTEKTYAYRHTCSKRYRITIKNGKVAWK